MNLVKDAVRTSRTTFHRFSPSRSDPCQKMSSRDFHRWIRSKMQFGPVLLLSGRHRSVRAKKCQVVIFIGEFGQRCSSDLVSLLPKISGYLIGRIFSCPRKKMKAKIFIGEFAQRCSSDLYTPNRYNFQHFKCTIEGKRESSLWLMKTWLLCHYFLLRSKMLLALNF